MRIYFKNMSRPKRIAESLQDYFPLDNLTKCQLNAARLLGYKDWHELAKVTEAGNHAPSPYDEDLSEEERDQRYQSLEERLVEEVYAVPYVSTFSLVEEAGLLSKKVSKRRKRLSGASKTASPMFRLGHVDLSPNLPERFEVPFDKGAVLVQSPVPEFGSFESIEKQLRKGLVNDSAMLRYISAVDVFSSYEKDIFISETPFLEDKVVCQEARYHFFYFDAQGRLQGFLAMVIDADFSDRVSNNQNENDERDWLSQVQVMVPCLWFESAEAGMVAEMMLRWAVEEVMERYTYAMCGLDGYRYDLFLSTETKSVMDSGLLHHVKKEISDIWKLSDNTIMLSGMDMSDW